MVADHVEIERKYDVDPNAALPRMDDFPGGAAVVATEDHELEATYFDTVNLDLARAGITLRCRTGGDDAGWHLKLPATGARTEVRAPLGPSTGDVPRRLRTTALAYTRGRELSVVAVVRTHRTVHGLLDKHGRVVVEVADDRVTASDTNTAVAKTWREWEVELVDGDRKSLEDAGRLLSGSGAEPSPWPSKLARTLHGRVPGRATPVLTHPRRKSPARRVVHARIIKQVDRLGSLDPLVRIDAPDALHDFRVTIRRLRAVLATYRPLLDREVTELVRAELKWLGSELSPARDTEVMRARLRTLLAQEPPVPGCGRTSAAIHRELDGEHRRARRRGLRALESARYLRLLDLLDELVATPPWTKRADSTVDDVLPARVRHDWKRLEARVSDARNAEAPNERARQLHEARKAAKRVRYAAEPLVPVYGKKAKRLVAATKRVQSILGDHHDSKVSQEWLRHLAESPTAHVSSFTLGVLYAREEANAADGESQFTAAWRKATDPKTLRLIS